MKCAVTVGVVSVVAAAFMVRSAMAVGFGALVGPIVILELAFLGAVYLLWRGLGGGVDSAETVEPARPSRGHRGPHEAKPAWATRPAVPRSVGSRSLVGRAGG